MPAGLVEIHKAVAAEYGLTYKDLLTPNTSRRYAEPRQVAMFLARELTTLTTTRIGNHFGRDHTTVVHAVCAVPVKCQRSAELLEHVDNARAAAIGQESFRFAIAREVLVYLSVADFCRGLDKIDELEAPVYDESSRPCGPVGEHVPPWIFEGKTERILRRFVGRR